MNAKIESRVKRIENNLFITTQSPVVVEMVYFAYPLPPERTENGITYRPVHFSDVKGRP
jgi:hypothetical protein